MHSPKREDGRSPSELRVRSSNRFSTAGQAAAEEVLEAMNLRPFKA